MDNSKADYKTPRAEPVKYEEPPNLARPENMKTEKETGQDRQENVVQASENAAGTKSGKPKIKGVSLTELWICNCIKYFCKLFISHKFAKVASSERCM